MPIKLVVFDMAGTTVKDDNNVSTAFKDALKEYGYEIGFSGIDPLMGYEKTDAIKQILRLHEPDSSKVTPQIIAGIHKQFLQGMIAFYNNNPHLSALPNVEDTFIKLHSMGVQIGVNTGFSHDIADIIVNRLQWREKGLIDCLVCSDDVELGRPHPLMIQKIMQQCGITDAVEVAKVGDTEVDVHEGQNAGCRFVIGITTGTFSRKQLESYSPTHIIDDIADVIDIIN